MGNGHVTFTTSDPDEARDTLTRLYLPLELLPERGELAMRLDATAHTALTIGLISFGPRIRVRCPPNAHYHVVLPLAGRARYHSGDGPAVVSEPGTATVFAPEAPAELDWAPGTEQLCVMLDGREVERELRQLLGRDVGPRLAFAARMDLSRGPARTWVEALMLLTRAARQESELLSHPLAARRLEQIVFDALLTGQPHNYSDQLTTGTASPGRSAVRCAVDLVQAYPDREWTTGRLAAAVSVSARALTNGFRAETGMTPMAYLQNVRLDRAHQDLLDTDPSRTTVTHVAGRWGFTHLGRFAAAYRARYEEPPSRTLRRRTW
ncbi:MULTISPECIES: AraC family transcriptional regulator [Amycolatopsis]|uniref:AraC family transcriptional regulator n=1 Tax=Amycolatopsis TaxID=1813 RepID=UPI00365D0A0A